MQANPALRAPDEGGQVATPAADSASEGCRSGSSAMTTSSGDQRQSSHTRAAPERRSDCSTEVSSGSRTVGGTGEWTVRIRRSGKGVHFLGG